MRNSQFIRGVGVGLLVSTLIFSVTTKETTTPMSEQEIIRKARQLGMYTEEEIKNQRLDESLSKVDGSVEEGKDQPADSDTDNDTETVSGSGLGTEKSDEDQEKPEETSPPTDVVKLTISQGMPSNEAARLLEDAGVVKSASAFDRYLCNHGYENYIRSGTYTFSATDDYETIAKTITKK
ncbi:MAG: hypothetical protein PUB10_09540 [Clostridiales bacterium]|nr:hypothetical protein [Clostridiales bacterium]